VASQTSTICPIGARVSLILSKYPTWCRSTVEPGCHDLTRLHVPILFNLSKRISSSITPMIASVWKFLPIWGMPSLTLELENVLFHFEPMIELGQEDRVMKCNTSRVMNHNPSLQGAMSPTHGWKSCLRDREVLSSNGLNIFVSPRSMHPTSFLVLPLLL
jgi:hypothetical protein